MYKIIIVGLLILFTFNGCSIKQLERALLGGTVKVVGKVVSETVKVTGKVVSGTVKVVGKVVSETVKVTGKVVSETVKVTGEVVGEIVKSNTSNSNNTENSEYYYYPKSEQDCYDRKMQPITAANGSLICEEKLLSQENNVFNKINNDNYKVEATEAKDEISYEKGTNVKLNGISKDYYQSGELVSEWNYKDGKLDGIAKTYYKSGALHFNKNYKDGKQNGITKGYYESGALHFEDNYKDGKVNGISKEYYESGKLHWEYNYKDGILNGTTKIYYESGSLRAEVTAKDDKAISGILYKKDGTKDREMTKVDFTKYGFKYDVIPESEKVYVAGDAVAKDGILYEKGTNVKLNGIAKLFYPSGKLKKEDNFKDGKFNGISKVYYESGVLKAEINFKDGKKNGISKVYFESGALVFEVTTKDDKAISGTLYKENGKKDRDMTNTDFTKYGFSS